MVSIRAATDADVESCVDVLAALPDHFTPDTHEHLRESLPRGRAWIATDGTESIAGFVLVEQRYARSAEIVYAAVRPDRHRRGIGTALVVQALAELSAAGVDVVEVKTLDAAAGYEPYLATRAFWEARGFVQIDCIDPLPGRQPGNPSAIYAAALRTTT